MLLAVEQTAALWTTQKISAVRSLIESTRFYFRRNLPKIYSHALLAIIFEQPYCRIKNLLQNNIARRQTASEYLKQLCRIGILREVRAGKEKLFIHPGLVGLMTNEGHEVKAYA